MNKIIRFIAGVVLALLCVGVGLPLSGQANTVQVVYGSDEVTVQGVAAGTRLFWIGVIRDQYGDQSRVRFVRGSAPATPKLSLVSGMPTRRSRWLIVSPGNSLTVTSSAPTYGTSSDLVVTRAVAGDDRISIISARIHGTYVRGQQAWAFGAADGTEIDLDHEVNGTIVLALSTLTRYRGNPHAPDVVRKGDGILLADPSQGRLTFVEVK
jgi:hypothetical protein